LAPAAKQQIPRAVAALRNDNLFDVFKLRSTEIYGLSQGPEFQDPPLPSEV
jgi:hypothetical protein